MFFQYEFFMSDTYIKPIIMFNMLSFSDIWDFKQVMPEYYRLTHCSLATPYGDIDLGQHWFRW